MESEDQYKNAKNELMNDFKKLGLKVKFISEDEAKKRMTGEPGCGITNSECEDKT